MLSIILTSFRSFYRNKTSLFLCIIFPSLLTYLLGSMLDGFYHGDNAIDSINIACILGEETSLSKPVEQYLDTLTEEGIVTIGEETALEEAQKKLKSGEIDGILAMEGAGFTLYEGTDSVANRTLRTLLSCYLRMEASYVAAYEQTGDFSILQDIGQQETKREENGHISFQGLGENQSMMDYYAVAMLVMIIFFACLIAGSDNITEDKKLHTQERIELSSLHPVKGYLGRVIGSLPMCAVQIGAMMLTSVFLFQARYCDTWQNNLPLIAMFFAVSFAVLTFASLLALLLPISPVLILLPLSWIMLALSGTFAKDIHISGVSEWMPSYQIQQAAFDLTVFGRRDGTMKVIIVSGLLFLICFAAGMILSGRRKCR